MNFSLKEILKNIIPGSLILVSILLCFDFHSDITSYKDIISLLIVLFLILSYILGHINDAIGSWGEDLFFVFFPRPSLNILQNKAPRFILPSRKEIYQNIIDESTDDYPELQFLTKKQAKSLIQIAKNKALKSNSELNSKRILSFYEAYIFSRNLFSSALISIPLTSFILPLESIGLAISISIILLAILFYRMRDRMYYYVRQVLIMSS